MKWQHCAGLHILTRHCGLQHSLMTQGWCLHDDEVVACSLLRVCGLPGGVVQVGMAHDELPDVDEVNQLVPLFHQDLHALSAPEHAYTFDSSAALDNCVTTTGVPETGRAGLKRVPCSLFDTAGCCSNSADAAADADAHP